VAVNRGTLEREVKLEAGVGFRIPDLDGLYPGITSQLLPEQHLQAVYVDTPDLRLVRAGLTLRHRSERSASSAPGEWTLKLPEPSAEPGLSRREINWPGKWGAVPAEIAGLVRAYRRGAGLGPIARLVTQRRRALLSGRLGEPLLEIDDDVVSVMDGRRLAARFREVEVEVVGAVPPSLLHAVVARLEEAGAVAGDARPKLVRAIGFRAAEPADVTPVPIKRTAPMSEVIRAAIAQGYLRLLAHDLGVRLDEDPEDVHQARVATRRLRSDLRTFREFLPEEWAQQTRAELGWVAEALGRARDADVLLERLQHEVDTLDRRDAIAAAGLIGKLVAEREQARDHLMGVFNSDRYGALLDRLVVAARELPPLKAPSELDQPAPAGAAPAAVALAPAVAAPAPPALATAATVPAAVATPFAATAAPVPTPAATTPSAATASAGPALAAGDTPAPLAAPHPPRPDRDAPARDLAPAVVSGPWRHLARAVSALGAEPVDEALHEVRIRAKRLRYACEAVAQVVGEPATQLARSAADLQGVLGDFHDAVVAEDWLRTASASASPAQSLAAGQLIARQRDDAARSRAGWHDSWTRLSRKKLRAWLTA
jgi:CHAD domain-containing protein